MEQIKIGKFIASLRKQHNLTQEELGEKLGVTNKTISRWENGNYMPDIEMFQLLSSEFNVTINELLTGEYISEENFKKKADENLVTVVKESAFSVKEKIVYFKKKWRKEHIFLFVILGVILFIPCILALVLKKPFLVVFFPLIFLVEYGYQNNRMMAYVEQHL